MSKCFSRVLLCRLQPWIEPRFAFSIGFRRHHQASELTRLVVHAIEKGIEWQRDTHVVKTDLTKAYDRTRWSIVWDELQERGAPGRLTRATIKLLDGREVEFFVRGFAQTQPLRMSRGLPQGDPISPALFVLALERTFGRLWSQWQREGQGIPSFGGPIPAIAFADDVYVLGAGEETQVSARMDDMSAALRKEGLCLAQHESSWLTTAKNPGEVLVTSDGDVPRQDMMQVLGSRVAVENSTSNAISFHLSRAWSAFHTHRCLLCKMWVSMARKLWLFALVVTSIVLWGLENFPLTQSDRRRLDVAQLTMISRMNPLGRGAFPTWLDGFTANRRRARRWLVQCGLSTWGSHAFCRYL